VYRQSATLEDGGRAVAVDPENRLLARAPRRRLDFEAMRDTLLAVSGRLQQRLGGRPVDVATNADASVRTVYSLVDRQSLPGLFRAFDFASPDQSIERRPRTMVPQQALFALNAPLMLAQAQALADRSARFASEWNGSNGSGEMVDARIIALYRLALARDPAADELADCREFVAAAQMDAWRQLAQTLLSSNELMYLD
jgi:hypothetical protein